MSQQLVSIIVPAFNAGRFIRRCAESILRQTHRAIELILVDDGSRDGTGALMDALAAADDRVRVIHLEKNGGIHDARAAGVRAANGCYVGFVDADDWVAPEMYADLLQAAEEVNADIAMCGAVIANAEGRLGSPKVRFPERRIVDDEILARFCRLEFGSGVLWNKLFRAGLIRDHAAVPLGRHLGEDYVVNFGCFAEAKRVITLPGMPYFYFQSRESASRSGTNAARFLQVMQGYVACLEIYSQRMPQHLGSIDELYARQMRMECYRVESLSDFGPCEAALRESIRRLAEIHPAGVYSMVNAVGLDRPKSSRPEGVTKAARNFLWSGRALARAFGRRMRVSPARAQSAGQRERR